LASAPHELIEIFRKHFPGTTGAPRIFCAPGRVNLIGEHTDYNLGFVMPIALDLACSVASAPSGDGQFRIWSENTGELREWAAKDLPSLKAKHDWSDYCVGVAQQLHKLGVEIPALNLAIDSTVPVGSGLSSSAAIEVSSALAILQGRNIDKTELARLCQRAENDFVGMPSGIMDQYVSVFGEAHKAIWIDCRSITHKTVTLPNDVNIIAVNSMVKHELGTSAYRDRVRECQEAVRAIQGYHPKVKSLRDVRSVQLEPIREEMGDIPYRRALHVTTENERVEAFNAAANEGNLRTMGELFVASHRSLQHDYEVSCEELDFLVDTAINISGVYGARMTGGGFGGCTVNLVRPSHAGAFQRQIESAYEKRYKKKPEVFRCIPADGAHEIV
jgi:galactokinase